MMEEWRKVTPFHDVSDRGRVRSWRSFGGGAKLKIPRILKPYSAGRGNPYPRVYLGKKVFSVHVLICFAWHGPRPEGMQCVRHLDGNPHNNTPANLCWGTHKENGQDEVRLERTWTFKVKKLQEENAELRARLNVSP